MNKKKSIMGKTNSVKQLLKQLLAAALLFVGLASPTLAQEILVTGTVAGNSDGAPIPGVNIVIKGTSNGTITDFDGNYKINVPSDAKLTYSYIGYDDQVVDVNGRSKIDIVLQATEVGISEVVVVGYGVQKKKLVTGATVQIKNEEFTRANVSRVESSLQGLTPGMSIVKQSGQPGSEYNITIRGLSSVNGNNPLVLIDGVPGSLSMLNPSDIESIDVLKDAASAAIYGSRAANGVVLVTTKKGKAGKTTVSYDGYYGFSNAPKTIDMLNAQEYATIMNEANSRKVQFTDEEIAALGEGTDWQKEVLNENAPSQSHYVGITGGSENSSYSLSLSYNSEEGIFNYKDKSNYERFGFRLNSEHKLKKYLKIGQNFTYNHRNTAALGTGNQYNNFIHDMFQACPLIDVYDENQPDGFGKSPYLEELGNPIASLEYKYNEKKRHDDFIGNIYAEIEILKNLKFRSDFGGTLNFSTTTNHTDTFSITSQDYNSEAKYSQGMMRNFGYNFDNVLTYNKTIGKHTVLAMVGMNAQDNWYFNISGERIGDLANDVRVIDNVPVVDTSYVYGDYGRGDSRFSYFGRLSYNYDEKYLATFTLRRDGSSRFGKNNRYGYFPSASIGWVVSNEEFFSNALPWMGFMKIRASWGQNGKEPADRFVYMAQVGNQNRYYTLGGNKLTGVSPIISANPDLKWEASSQTNIGIDARFLKHFNFVFDYYRKTSTDWIMQTTVPGISGIAGIDENSNPYINGGNVENEGVEFELGFQNNFGDLNYNIKGNIAYNKNNVTEVPGEVIHGSSSVLFNGSEEFYQVREGYPIGYFFGYETDGIFQSETEVLNHVNSEGELLQKKAEPGDVRRVDVNEDGIINDEDKIMLGDPNPDFIYGLNLSTSFRGLDFSVSLQGVSGNQIVQSYRAQERYFYNFRASALDRWTPENPSNTTPRITNGTESNKNYRNFSDLYIQDGSYIKIKSVNLGYDLKRFMPKVKEIEQFRIYVAASNLFTFTNYDGLDPEVGYGSYYDASGKLKDAYASGIDMGFYPSAKTYIIGVNLKF